MKPTGLLKLILLSFALVAFWLVSAPGFEHPWDDDEVVASDSGNVFLGDITPEPGTEEIDVIVFFISPRYSRPFGFGLFILNAGGGSDVRKNTLHRTSIQSTKRPRSDLPVGRLINNMK
jgi:hypothetical protein